MPKSTGLLAAAVGTSSAVLGGAVALWLYSAWAKKKKKQNPELDASVACAILENCIMSSLQSSGLYIGDKLGLYKTLSDACGSDKSITSIELAKMTGFHQRWLREWLAQQAAMGILVLLPCKDENHDSDEKLRYRLPSATARVLADPTSKDYGISMIQVVPSMVHRAKTMLPQAFCTGMGIPYNESDISQGIDRHHAIHVREIFLKEVLPRANGGTVLKKLQEGNCTVADLGCGGGCLLVTMAETFPTCNFHGYEVSQEALEVASDRVQEFGLSNVVLHDANVDPLGNSTFDLVLTYDVLHDAPHPQELIHQVRKALGENGVWLLADIPCEPTVRENIEKNAFAAAAYWSFSLCLCMSCATSDKGGAGLGTLGFSVPVAKKMLLEEGGFDNVEVLLEKDNARWFVVT